MADANNNKSHSRHRIPSWKLLCAGGLLLILMGRCNNQNIHSATGLRHRRLHEHPHHPTASPSMLPLHVSMENSQNEFEYDSQSNDNEQGDDESLIKDKEQFNREVYTDDSEKRLGIISVSIAAVFAALMMVTIALVWRKHLWTKNSTEVTEEVQEQEPEFDNSDTYFSPIVDNKPKNGDGGVSILRNKDSETADYNPGRRVRFQLPGSASSFDRASIVSAEGGEDIPMVPIDEEDGVWEEPLSKKIRITVQDRNTLELDAGSKHRSGHPPPNIADIFAEENAIPVKPEVQTDQEAWVTRILHPWLNSSLCCPDDWDDCTNGTRSKSPTALGQDQSTVATNSFESSTSSQSNEETSVTPIMPPFPTSTYDSQYDADDDDDTTKAAERTDAGDKLDNGGVTGPVLGIMDRNAVAPDDSSVILDGQRKRGREPATSSPPPARDTWYDGDSHIVSHPKEPSKKSAWRKRAWASPPREGIDTSPLDDEFDIESYPEEFSYRPRSPRRLFEI